MKKAFFAISFGCFAGFFLFAGLPGGLSILSRPDVSGGNPLQFDHTLHEFGALARGVNVNHQFTFRNSSNDKVVLKPPRTSCGCIIVGGSKGAVEPLGEGSIDVVFATREQNAEQTVWQVVLDYEVQGRAFTQSLRLRARIRPDIQVQPEEVVFAEDETHKGRSHELIISREMASNEAFGSIRILPHSFVKIDKIGQTSEKAFYTVSLDSERKPLFVTEPIVIEYGSGAEYKKLLVPLRYLENLKVFFEPRMFFLVESRATAASGIARQSKRVLKLQSPPGKSWKVIRVEADTELIATDVISEAPLREEVAIWINSLPDDSVLSSQLRIYYQASSGIAESGVIPIDIRVFVRP